MARTTGLYQFGPFQLDPAEHRLLREGAEVSLQLKAFELLCVLVENAGRLIKKEELLARIWPDAVVEENNLNKNVSVLRKALGESATGQTYIETVPRVGYRFVASVSDIGSQPVAPRETGGPTASTARQKIQFCVTRDGVRLAYSSAGSGYPLVKSANWLNHLDYEWDSPLWKHWLAGLTQHHRLIRYDERGNGLSQWDVKEMSLELWVQDLETVVEAAGVEKFALMGISQGGAVAIAYAIRHPDRVSHLVLINAFSRGLEARGTEKQLAGRRALQTLMRLDWGKNNPDFKSMFTKFYIPQNSTPEQQQWFNDLQRISASPENAARIMVTIDEINIRHLLPQVSVPTIIFHGDHDRVIPAEEGRILAAEIPGARFVPLNTGNHILLAEEPAWRVFLDELGTFLGWQKASARPAV
ncbi:MAG TPA: alpha/beta fold hydrolase [Candidatus Limnocylindrales bacterium]|nr:alpha/beta fold hydrolase [Candidatus Limnocylindrales bacterium]